MQPRLYGQHGRRLSSLERGFRPRAAFRPFATRVGAQVIEINPERTDLTGWISDFIIQEKAGVAIPQIVAGIQAMAS